MMEISNDIHFLLPIMVGVMIAKCAPRHPWPHHAPRFAARAPLGLTPPWRRLVSLVDALLAHHAGGWRTL